MYVRNAWYVAAWERELTAQPLPVTLLGERVVLFRTASGRFAALEDACVHRKLPLSMGRVRGDEIECGYHGLKFDAAGRCTHIPCAERIPRNAFVRSYPIEARYGLLWIWMGEAARASPDSIMAVAHFDDPGWARTAGDDMRVDCNYLYVTDNLLDPSHVAWVHQSTFGDVACEATPVSIIAKDTGLAAARWMHDTAVAPLYRQFVRFSGRCDRLQHYEVQFPSQALIKAVFVPAGAGAADAESHPEAFVMDSYNLLTPVDATHTRYFWFQVYNARADAASAAAMAAGVRTAFEEDRVILNAVQRGFDGATSGNIDIAIDSAPLRFRRRIRALIDAEQGAAEPIFPTGGALA
jgi:phenylpropionate dioxygenase-like ring-hydroxylating dioxygenase large terminal subunit